MSTDSRFEQPQQQQVVEAQPNRFVEQAWGPQGRVPQEFQRHHSGGDTVNIYIDHANINMANGRPEFAGCDPNVRRMQDMRRIQYYDDNRYYGNYGRDNYYCNNRQPWNCQPPRHHERPPVYVQPPRVYVEPPQVYVRPPQVYVEPRYYEPTPRYYPPVYSQPQNMDAYQDSVHGGRDGYTASRTRIQTGNGSYDPYYGGVYNQRDDFDRMTDLGFGILDRVFANEANKRATRGRR